MTHSNPSAEETLPSPEPKNLLLPEMKGGKGEWVESKTEDQGSCLPPKPLEAVVERALEMMLEALGLNLHFALTEAMSQGGTFNMPPILKIKRFKDSVPCPKWYGAHLSPNSDVNKQKAFFINSPGLVLYSINYTCSTPHASTVNGQFSNLSLFVLVAIFVPVDLYLSWNPFILWIPQQLFSLFLLCPTSPSFRHTCWSNQRLLFSAKKLATYS